MRSRATFKLRDGLFFVGEDNRSVVDYAKAVEAALLDRAMVIVLNTPTTATVLRTEHIVSVHVEPIP